MPDFDDPYERFKNNVRLLRSKKQPNGKKITLEIIAAIWGAKKGRGNLSRYMRGIEIPMPDTLNRYNILLEEKLTNFEEDPAPDYRTRQEEHSEEIQSLKITVEELKEKVDRILTLLDKGGSKTEPSN